MPLYIVVAPCVCFVLCSRKFALQDLQTTAGLLPGRDAAYTPVDSLGNSVNGALLEVGVEDMQEELLIEICNQNHEVIAMNSLHLSDMWEVRLLLRAACKWRCILLSKSLVCHYGIEHIYDSQKYSALAPFHSL